jgi:histidyl-tRNA synthetase
MTKLIEPRTLKGFRDFLPREQIVRERLIEQARRVYRSYGFAPIDTPALEYTEILLGKAGDESDKLMYRFTDHGDRDVSMRFDLTVPFARFAAQHIGTLGTPFKRYHMGPVWRGENTGHGRYREFWQCDFDTIGTTSNAADIETVLVINDLFEAIGVERFEIHVNNRLVLNGFLELHGLADKAVPILRALDKLPKIGRESVVSEMQQAGIEPGVGFSLVDLAEMPEATPPDRNGKIIQLLHNKFANMANEKVKEGIHYLHELLTVTKRAGMPEQRISIDLNIARGLDYYTGTIYETFLLDMPEIGSVCSGGRYDNLAGLYTKQQLPGVGASLGLDRLLTALDKLGYLKDTAATPAPVLVVQFDPKHLGDYERLARTLRGSGVGVEVYPDAKKIGQQLKYAESRGFRVALIAGSEEFTQGVWKVKDLGRREEKTLPEGEIVAAIHSLLKS